MKPMNIVDKELSLAKRHQAAEILRQSIQAGYRPAYRPDHDGSQRTYRCHPRLFLTPSYYSPTSLLREEVGHI